MQKRLYQTFSFFFLFTIITPFIYAQEVLQEQKGTIIGKDFKVMTPESWQIKENTVWSPYFNLARSGEKKDTLRKPTITVTYNSLLYFQGSPEAYVDSIEKEVGSFFAASVLESRERIEFMGLDAQRYIITTEYGKVKLKDLTILFFMDRKVFKLSYITAKQDFDFYLEEGEKILNSFEFIKTPRYVPDVIISENLHFFTEKEASHFTYIQDKNKKKSISSEDRIESMHEAFNLLFAVGNVGFDESVQYEKEYFDFLEKLAQDIPLKKRKKKIKEIYDLIHEIYFESYGENVLFYEIFQHKKYNCVYSLRLVCDCF